MKFFVRNYTFIVMFGLGLCWFASFQAAETTPPSNSPSKKDTQLSANNDHGFWAIQQFEVILPRNWSVLLQTEQRWGSDYKLFWYQGYEIIFFYDLTKSVKNYFEACSNTTFNSFSLASGCTQISRIQKNTQGVYKWVGETRPLIQADLTLDWKNWSLSQRLRGQYTSYNASHYKSHGALRYRLFLSFPWKFTSLEVAPFISNEFFFRANTYSKSHPKGLVGGFHQNRLRIGLTSTFMEDKLTFQAWWQWRPIKQTPGTHPLWSSTYQFGVIATFSWPY